MSTHILIIDDEPHFLETLRMMLECYNYSVNAFDNGHDALGYLRANPCIIQLAMVDLMMPGLSGLEVIIQLKADPKLA
ncbi:MAG: response regulator transcription factor, partial [Burkholderiales bacterium]